MIMLSIPNTAFLDETPEEEFDIIQTENNQILSGSLTRQIINEGIVINCSPIIGDVISPDCLTTNNFSIFKNFVNKDVSILQKRQKNLNFYQNQIEIKTIEYNDSKKIFSILSLLEDQNEKITKVITDFSVPYRQDEKFNKRHSLFNENVKMPKIIEILNNLEEVVFLPEDDTDRQNYIYRLSYPLNYNNSINLQEGVGIEPFSIFNPIQFKTKQEFEFNRFWANIDNSLDVRNNAINQSNIININDEKQASYLENITKSTYFVKGNSLGGFVSTQSYVFLDKTIKNKPFYDLDTNVDYKNKNYSDNGFKKVFGDLKLYEKIINREENILFKENDKFTSCGFDYSYTNSLGKNSIAFKGLE